jgi:cystathionine gamma-synthase
MSEEHKLDTRCVHAGELKDPQGSPHTPIYNSTTFAFNTKADLLDVVEGRREGNLYTRHFFSFHPTL